MLLICHVIINWLFPSAIYIDCVFLLPCMCVFGSSRIDSGTEPVEESYDFDTTQEDPSVGFYPGEPLYLCYLYFDALPLSIILALLRCFVDTNPICMFPAASYYLIPISYKPLFVFMLALRVLVHAQVVSSLFYNLVWICYFGYNFTWYSLLLLIWETTNQR